MSDMPTKIFLAEDDDDMRCMLSTALRNDGYDVTEARDGAELLSLLASASSTPKRGPDVIVSDVLMPGYSGIGVLAALRNSQWDVPVVLITAHRDGAIEEDAKRLGVAAFVRKPFDVDELRAAILVAALSADASYYS
jgi:CheY-like chemotaxis protein